MKKYALLRILQQAGKDFRTKGMTMKRTILGAAQGRTTLDGDLGTPQDGELRVAIPENGLGLLREVIGNGGVANGERREVGLGLPRSLKPADRYFGPFS